MACRRTAVQRRPAAREQLVVQAREPAAEVGARVVGAGQRRSAVGGGPVAAQGDVLDTRAAARHGEGGHGRALPAGALGRERAVGAARSVERVAAVGGGLRREPVRERGVAGQALEADGHVRERQPGLERGDRAGRAPARAAGRQAEVRCRADVAAILGMREVAHPARGEHLPDGGAVTAAEPGVGGQDRVAHVEEGRLGRRHPHALGDQLLRVVAADRVAQVPQRLRPDLAVEVDLGSPGDLPEVGVRVAAAARALRHGRAHRAVDRLRADGVRGLVDVVPDVDLARRRGVGHQVVAHEQVHRVPVAPALPHRARLRARQRAGPVVVHDQAVGQPVRVLVPDDRGRVAPVDGAERRLEQVQLHRRLPALGQRQHVGVVDVGGVGAAVGAVVGLDLHGVDVLEPGELDLRVVRQVVVEAVDEIEGLHAVLLAVDAPRVGRRPGPTCTAPRENRRGRSRTSTGT